MEFGRKRMVDGAFAGNGGTKKPRNESESFTSGVGSKSKPCMKFYSTSGCSYGEACHFLHHVPGYSAMSQISNMGLNPAVPTGRNTAPFSDGPASSMKSKLCNKYNSAEGCRFGDKCHFAHSEMEIGKPVVPAYDDFQAAGPHSMFSGYHKPSQFSPAATNFGASATTTISIDAALAGTIIGKNGVNSKQICRVTGVKLSIKEHETDSNRRNIELQGTFDQINQASAMVREIISNVGTSTGGPKNTGPFTRGPPGPFKTKMCANFSRGSCTFGEKCHFAHGANELQKPLA
ncbi:zinc finger CCCH domain-containing protein 14-like [Lycium ferocissimum]|uniref:zinc finger CCCH domain-containing protein 14-like n=1 Tax=Lycium ferocissimum TaxID=112874 RepID=UPI0028161885|nr:zinc finger CCCH domain-containing protein 14-like [Lycium ferocissimum]